MLGWIVADILWVNYHGHFGWILVDTIWDSPNGPHGPLDLVHWRPGKADLVWSAFVKVGF